MNDEVKDKKVYELALLLKVEEDLPAVIALLKAHNGELTQEPRAKKLALAYKIEGHTEGVFVSVIFRSAPEDVKNLEHDLNVKAEVVRSLIMIAPKTTDRPMTSPPPYPAQRRGRPPMSSPYSPSSAEPSKPAAPRPSGPLSNEALEKKIEEILK